MELELTGNGYLVDPSIWTEEIMYELARLDDNFELTDEHVKYILSAREVFSETQTDRAAHPRFRQAARHGPQGAKAVRPLPPGPHEDAHQVRWSAPADWLRLSLREGMPD